VVILTRKRATIISQEKTGIIVEHLDEEQEMNIKRLQAKWFYALPFILIVGATVFMLRGQPQPQPQPSPLPPPQEDLVLVENRMTEIWDFALSDLTGKTVHLSDFQGKAVLLNFFGTWCPPCGEEMPSFEKLFQRNRNRGLVVLGIAGDPQGAKTVVLFVQKYQLSFPVLLDQKNQVAQQYFVRNLPLTYFIDKKGHIAGMHRGAADWNSDQAQRLTDHLLQEPVE
jgi:peroxiredoxin